MTFIIIQSSAKSESEVLCNCPQHRHYIASLYCNWNSEYRELEGVELYVHPNIIHVPIYGPNTPKDWRADEAKIRQLILYPFHCPENIPLEVSLYLILVGENTLWQYNIVEISRTGECYQVCAPPYGYPRGYFRVATLGYIMVDNRRTVWAVPATSIDHADLGKPKLGFRIVGGRELLVEWINGWGDDDRGYQICWEHAQPAFVQKGNVGIYM